ncbi:bestrophin-like domain [Mycobacterium avium]|uniref:DUF4239 domain-containing protein n=1 Tax=Mycobacterium avium subsp. hominissuis TaxID=439334 RepID=A0A3B6X7H0_MYCAV|nr:DUF4239 domain-containing protein [Mycobacterium avium]ETB28226.1 hypothetical protein O971_15230 [Mycobacterium avium subsp. hominissuis 10-4249]AXO22873.1 DUF4239 domain-containing protein [Mycobacterium avium subsp. hominissuis]KDO95033.1 hypothetical protein MAVA5_14370 [Mycobacterium avium subsp. hominissuis A5]MBZ4509942.1 DUF4239 domain-containing protein [Mycobacterium avium subsp. hominissuis]PBA71059.1 DUF4239 domain-containing protein [Mycobacterium avium]
MSGPGLPLWLLLVCAVAAAIAVAAGAIWLGRRLLHGRQQNPAIASFLTVVGFVYGALLGFTVVATWEHFSSTQVVVSAEASALTTMYRQSVAMPEPERTEIQELLRKYAGAVAGPEWNKQRNEGARAAITRMYRTVGRQQPNIAARPINQQFLNQLSELASDRNERIVGTKPRIPPLLWAGLIFGAVVLVAFTGFLRLGSTVGHVVVSGTVAVLLALLLCTVFELDHSYATDQRITSGPFQHALDIFDAVDNDSRYFPR